QVTPDGFADVIATNLSGYFHVARAFTPLFLEQRRGRFLTVTMNHETMRRRGFVPYGPSRAGAESLSLIMSEDLRPHGIAVNLLLPGGATLSGMIPDELSDEQRRALLPAEVMGPPAVFLASAEAEGLTGERIVANDFEQWLATRRGGRRHRRRRRAARAGAAGTARDDRLRNAAEPAQLVDDRGRARRPRPSFPARLLDRLLADLRLLSRECGRAAALRAARRSARAQARLPRRARSRRPRQHRRPVRAQLRCAGRRPRRAGGRQLRPLSGRARHPAQRDPGAADKRARRALGLRLRFGRGRADARRLPR